MIFKNAFQYLLFVIFMTMLTCLPLTAFAQNDSRLDDPATSDNALNEEPVDAYKQRADRFYKKCLGAAPEDGETAVDNTDRASCACMSAHLLSWLKRPSKDAPQTRFGVFTGPANEQLDDETWMVQVYGPCLYISAREIIYDECMYTDKYHLDAPQPIKKKRCTCLANGMSDYFRGYAPLALQKAYERYGRVDDMMRVIRNGAQYYNEYRALRNTCLRRYKID